MSGVEGIVGQTSPAELTATNARQSEGVQLQSELASHYRVGKIFAAKMSQLRNEGKLPDYDQSIHGDREGYVHTYGPLVIQALEEARHEVGLPPLAAIGPTARE